MTAEEAYQQVAAAGYRLTGPRRKILEAVIGKQRHFTAPEVVAELAATGTPVGRATAFRTLELLAQVGLLSRVHESDGCHGYTVCGPEHHHHLVCSGCGLVRHLPGCAVLPPAQDDPRIAGFRVDGHRLEFYGLCGSCQKESSSHPFGAG